jgi:hypothetical protein
MESKPIFIHSLFRAGSTYLFHVFRRSDTGYWCYQEPLHELSYYSKEDRDLLLSEKGEKMVQLRHPSLGDPYFLELYKVADDCLGSLSEESVYDAYFAMGSLDSGIGFWRSLIHAAHARPVIQECRTSGRISTIKSALGGFHLYLWRNPWDQWWSYKVDRYFDLTSQLFINSPHHPGVIALLRQEIDFKPLNQGDIEDRKQWFMKHPLSPEDSYLVFYVLWLLGLQQGTEHGDLLINIDRLGGSQGYRHQVAENLADNGITNIDFSDCSIPQTTYSSFDREFFQSIEEKAHALFLSSGMSREEIDRLQAIRQEYEPECWGLPMEDASAAAILRDAQRARSLAIAGGAETTELCTHFHGEIALREQCVADAKALARQAESLALQAEIQAQQSEARSQQSESKAHQSESRAQQSEARALQAEITLQAVCASTSWRLTQPLRFLGNLFYWLIRMIRSIPGRIKQNFNLRVRSILHWGICFVQARPAVSSWILYWLQKVPRLKARLRNLAMAANSSSYLDRVSTSFMPENMAHFSPRVKKNYHDLKNAVEQHKKEGC